MEPFEVMVSESQERMLCVVEPRNVAAVLERLREVGGRTAPRSAPSPTAAACACCATASCSATCRSARSSTTARSTTSRPPSPTRADLRAAARDARAPTPTPERDACSRCSRARTSPRGGRCSSSTTRSCSRARSAAPSRPTPPCSRSPDGSALAVSIDCNGRRVAADPRNGTIAAVLECAANLACVGAEPLGTTNNLNFGNPEKPHIAWQLTEAVARPRRGLPRARRADRGRQRLALQRGRRPARSTRRP